MKDKKYDEGKSVLEYRWMAFRRQTGQVFAWYREKDMRRELPTLGGEFDIFKKVRHRICRKKLYLDHEIGYNEDIQRDL